MYNCFYGIGEIGKCRKYKKKRLGEVLGLGTKVTKHIFKKQRMGMVLPFILLPLFSSPSCLHKQFNPLVL